MRREQKNPKAKQVVLIPDDLATFLRDVYARIEADDDAATIESDDLLQCEIAYGGLIETGGNQYGFTYFPEKGTRQKWELALDTVDIANIAEGSITTLTLWGCQSEACHCLFADSEEACFYCDYVDDDRYGNFSVQDAIPRLRAEGIDGLTEHSSRDDIIAILGPPDESGGGVEGHPGFIYPWIKYLREACQIHFGLSKNGGRLKNVNILPKDWKAGV